VKAEALEERSWKRKQTGKHFTFSGAGSRSIFHKTWGRDEEAVKIFVEAKAL